MTGVNEYSIIMKLITRPGNPMGAGIDDILDALGLPEGIGNHIAIRHLAGLHERLRELGLMIRHNPVNNVFYLDTVSGIELEEEETPLPDRLAATLLVVITLTYQEGEWVLFSRVKEFRNKAMRGIREDLRELAEMGYVEVDRKTQRVRPGTKVAFEIDYETFFRRLAASDSE
jgi:hypothetical protein